MAKLNPLKFRWQKRQRSENDDGLISSISKHRSIDPREFKTEIFPNLHPNDSPWNYPQGRP